MEQFHRPQSPDEPAYGSAAPRRIEELVAALEARAVAAGRAWQASLPVPVRETTFDTDDRRLERAGVELVLREENGRAMLLGQPRSGRTAGEALASGLATVPVSMHPLEADALAGALGERVRAVVGARALRPRSTRGCRRVAFRALENNDLVEAGEIVEHSDNDSGSIELAPSIAVRLDRPSAALGDWLARAGVEQVGDTAPAGSPALDALDYGLARIGDGSVAVTSEMSAGEAAHAVLRRQVALIVAHEPVARLGEDPSGVHDMRVAIRRARAALKIFGAYVPGASGLDSGLRWAASRLGPVRDLDVQLSALPTWKDEIRARDREAMTPIESWLRRRRERERQRMLRALDSPRWERLVARLIRLLGREPSSRRAKGRSTVLVEAPGWIADSFRRVVQLARLAEERPTPTRLHKLRIRCKALRYALEFHESLFPETARAIRTLTALQDLLGEHQDAVVAEERLRALAAGSGPKLPRESIFVCGRLAERRRRRARRLRRQAPKAIERFIDRERRQFTEMLLDPAARTEPIEREPRS